MALPLLFALALTACGADPAETVGAGSTGGTQTEGTSVPGPTAAGGADGSTADGTADGDAGACLVGATECADIPTGTGGVVSGPDGSVPIADAVEAGIMGPFLISGFLVADGEGARLCQALLESLPPQCGGTSLLLEPAEVPAGVTTTTEGGVVWSEDPVLVEGEIVDGTFVVRDA